MKEMQICRHSTELRDWWQGEIKRKEIDKSLGRDSQVEKRAKNEKLD